jgi:leader peptidase (prepilin peptidase)/N-methyltransferase
MIYYWFMLGLVVGSFLNVCIYRLPREKSIIWPSSHCPECGRGLSPLELIPVVSYLLLRGRCRHCGQKIAWRYPLVELLAGAGFAAVFVLSRGELLPLIALSIFFSVLVVIFSSISSTPLSLTTRATWVLPRACSIIFCSAGRLFYRLLAERSSGIFCFI